MGQYLCWWTIGHYGYLPPCNHWVNTSAGELLVTTDIFLLIIIGSIPLLVNYWSLRYLPPCNHWVNTSAGELLVTTDIFLLVISGQYLCWWTIGHYGYLPPCNQWSIPLLVNYWSLRTLGLFIRNIYYCTIQFSNKVIINKNKGSSPPGIS